MNREPDDVPGFLKRVRSKSAPITPESLSAIDAALDQLCDEIRHAPAPVDRFLLAHYFTLGLLRKTATRGPGAFTSDVERSAQILLLDSTRQHVLLQRRGPYKHLFPSKLTVSANAKWQGDSSCAPLAAAVLRETGLVIDPDRFEPVGSKVVTADWRARHLSPSTRMRDDASTRRA